MSGIECDLLDLGSVGKIQTQGFLLCIYFHRDGETTCIRNVSSNIVNAPFSLNHLKKDPRLYIGKRIAQCFSKGAVRTMEEMLKQYPIKDSIHASISHDGSKYHTTLRTTRSGLLFEILPEDDRQFDSASHVRDLQTLMAHTDSTRLFKAACEIVTRTVGYDRSIVYQFQEDLSGKVVYEEIVPALQGKVDSYIGMYFPESDIPLPARKMFLIRPLRVIYDVDIEPADVIGNEGQREETPDLSQCTLRCSHPVHISYMQNMGLRSSMSIGIVADNQLWGLMTFHAYGRAVCPKGWVTTFLESLSVPVSTCFSKMQREDLERRRDDFSTVVHHSFSGKDVFGYFAQYAPDLLKVLQADCVSIKLEDRIKSWGDADLVICRTGVEIVSKDAVGKDWAVGELSDPARGVISIVHGDLTVVFIRKSIFTDKVWAGDPSYAKIMRPDGVPGPRGSFARYVQAGVDSRNRWNARDKQLATYVSSRIKLLVSTVEFFTQKTNALLEAYKHVKIKKGTETTGCKPLDYSVIPVLSPIPTPVDQVEKHAAFDNALISHFAHELKTPIHGVSSSLDLILTDEPTPAHVREYARVGLACVTTLTQAVNSVLTIVGQRSRVTGDRKNHNSPPKDNNLERVSLQNFVGDLENEFGRRKGFSVTSTVDDDHDHIFIDASLLQETMPAIIHNSFRQIQAEDDTGDIRVSVSCCSTHREATMAWKGLMQEYSHRSIRNSEEAASHISESDAWYTFSVQDSGCGIHGDMLDNVLAHHDDARKSTKVKNSHQGIGLCVYKCISNVVFDLNGSFGIASTISKGTVVSKITPARVAVGLREEDIKTPGIKSTEGGDVGAVLVVDDNTVNRKLAAKLIAVACTKAVGAAPTVKQFADGRVCIEEIKTMRKKGEKIMGILMDFHMPVMSGKEATAHIRESEARESFSKIPIFGFTAGSSENVKEELLSSGMDDVLPKPLSIKMLQEACIKILAGPCDTTCPKERSG